MNAGGEAQRSFGDWLRHRRRELDLTREELARQVGCSTITLRKLEAEERRPSKQMVERLAEVLKIAPDDRLPFLQFARGDPFAAPGEPRRQPAAARRHNLPHQLTNFIGREKEIEEIRRVLNPGLTPTPDLAPSPDPKEGSGEGERWRESSRVRVRLLTLTGVGGTGKTRLALQAAAGLVDQFPDGVWLVELAPLADPALVAQTVAGVLGIQEQAGRPILAALTDHLRGPTVLLVLDNCEHLIAACAQFAAALLQGCPNLRLLATSREGLGIPGEVLFVVPALSSPNSPDLPSLDALIRYEAVRLFVERASAALPGFALTNDNAPVVVRICRQLDGIPLAIELAAARVKVLQVEQIAARLNDRFRLLTGGSRAALPRHQTLQALIDWSYDLLPAAEQVLLRRLAVFAGGWTLAAAEAAVAGDGLQAGDTLDLLTQLVNKSLVAVERQPGHEARYRLLETIRQYALEKLAASGEADDVWRRLAEYYIELVKADTRAGQLTSYFEPYRPLEPERDNLRAALAWSQSAAGAKELGLRLAAAAMGGWIGHGYWSETQVFLERALAHAEGTADARAQARVLHGLGAIAHFQGDQELALAHLLHSLSRSRALHDLQAAGATLWILADVALEQGDVATASARLEESRALLQEMGDTEGVAWAIRGLGDVAVMQEDSERATAYFEESLALFPVSEKATHFAWVRVSLGQVAQLQKDYERAQRLYEECRALIRQDGEPKLALPAAIQGLGEAALGLGDANQAAEHFRESLRLFHDEGDRGGVSFCLAGLAGAAALAEEPARAARLWGAAEALRQSIGARQAPATRVTRERLMAAAREQLGEAAWAAAWAEGAAMTMEQAVALALDDEDPKGFRNP